MSTLDGTRSPACPGQDFHEIGRNSVLWIRIRMDPHHFGNLNPDPHPHQSHKLDPDPNPDQFADANPKYKEYEHI
jgi:hypothetical protein